MEAESVKNQHQRIRMAREENRKAERWWEHRRRTIQEGNGERVKAMKRSSAIGPAVPMGLSSGKQDSQTWLAQCILQPDLSIGFLENLICQHASVQGLAQNLTTRRSGPRDSGGLKSAILQQEQSPLEHQKPKS